jgi:hypothetical protein
VATPAHTNAELVRSHEIELGSAVTPTAPASRLPLVAAVVAVVLGGAAIGGVLALRASQAKPVVPPVVAAVPVAVTPEPPAPARPAEVRFELASQPPGATVFRDGQAVGQTPFALTLPREGEAPVQAELRFALEGYEDATVIAQGLEGVVTVTKALEKKAVEPPKTPVTKKPPPGPQPPDGYKDDPY